MLRLLDWLEESEAKGEWYAIQRRRVLKFAKVKRMDSERGRRRSQRALNRTEVARLLDVWAADPRLVGHTEPRPAAPDDLYWLCAGPRL